MLKFDIDILKVYSCMPTFCMIVEGMVKYRSHKISKFGHICSLSSRRGDTTQRPLEIWQRRAHKWFAIARL